MVTLILIGLLGGLVTGVSPCILPMLPILFFAGGAGADKPAATTPAPERVPVGAGVGGSGGGVPGGIDTAPVAPPKKRRNPVGGRPLKIIAGLIVSFTVFTLAGSLILSALGLPQSFLRWAGVTVLAAVGVGLMFPQVEELLQKPFARLPKVQGKLHGNPFLFGLGLGTLYVPCAGPVLAAITVAGATGHVGVETVALTLSFAVGAALPLLVFAAAGDRVRERVAAYRRRAKTFRLVGGTSMVVLAIALALGATDALQRAVPDYTSGLQKSVAESEAAKGALTGLTNATNTELSKCTPGATDLGSCGTAPPIDGITKWLNTPDGAAVKLESLRGHPVLIDFWAYSCINCQRSIPHVVAWNKAYADAGLKVIGVHAPEFAFEKSSANVAAATKKMGITYPVAQDNSLTTWTNYRNQYWPAEYLIDAKGTVRAIRFGEGDYQVTETQIRALLTEANPGVTLPAATDLPDTAPTGGTNTPETYFGYQRSTTFQNATALKPGTTTAFTLPPAVDQDRWSLGGTWKVESQYVEAVTASTLDLSYRARDVYLVLGGTGTVKVTDSSGVSRTVNVTGPPTLYTATQNPASRTGTLTVTASKGVQFYTATFG